MKKSLLAAALAAALVVPAVATAQDEDVNTGALTFSLGVDWVSSYFFRGYNNGDTGFIVQPSAAVGFAVVDTDDFASTLSIGTWNSLHSTENPTWYESDFIAKLTSTYKPLNLSGTFVYTYYTFPTDAAADVQELGFEFGIGWFDELLKDNNAPFTLNPYVGIYREIYDSTTGPGDLGSEGTYLEIGVVPSFALEVGELPGVGAPTIMFPIKTGISIDKYYTDSDGSNEFFGYLSIGAGFSAPLAVPARWGQWALTGGVEYLYLAADSAEQANDGGENYEVIGKLGLAISY
jgi:hypothetical protein